MRFAQFGGELGFGKIEQPITGRLDSLRRLPRANAQLQVQKCVIGMRISVSICIAMNARTRMPPREKI